MFHSTTKHFHYRVSIIGPKKIRPNTNYTVVLSNALSFHAQMRLSLENEDDLKMEKLIVVQRRSVQAVDFVVSVVSFQDFSKKKLSSFYLKL